MYLPPYSILEKADDYSEYRFVSTGPNGDIVKVILFQSLPIENLYNLSLLDVLPNGKLSDISVSNNNDMPKILATAIRVIVDYTAIFPERMILFQGSDTGRRNALYKRVIEKHFNALKADFNIIGITSDHIEESFDTMNDYVAFLIVRK